MKCPVCTVELKIYVRQGIEVDYCPECRGVWLDRGELDKIIEASQNANQAAPVPQTSVPPQHGSGFSQPRQPVADYRSTGRRDHDGDDDDHRYNNRYDNDTRYGKPRKKRGLLGEIFDVFD